MKSNVAIILLAAGMARRMGEGQNHKLLAAFEGIPLVRRSALIATQSDATSVTVVVGHREDEIRAALAGLPLAFVRNPDFASGMASSLAVGFDSADAAKADGVLVQLADMPALTTDDLNLLISRFRKAGEQCIVRAVCQGEPGNPVILPRAMREAVYSLKGDIGARRLVEASVIPILDVEIGRAAALDVDTPDGIRAAGGIPESR